MSDAKYVKLLDPFKVLGLEIHKHCNQLHTVNPSDHISVNIHNQHYQKNVYDIYTTYMMFVSSRVEYDRTCPTMDLTSEYLSHA